MPFISASPPPCSEEEGEAYAPEAIYHLAGGRLFFTTHSARERTARLIADHPDIFFFSSNEPESYEPFCADHGPVDISSVTNLCRQVRDFMEHPLLQKRHLVFYTSTDPAHVSNAALLLSCYLVLELGYTPEQASSRFDRIMGLPIVRFRDATWQEPTFTLSILDCLCGLRRATQLGWFDHRTFDVAYRERICEREEHDICRVTPGLVAFATPNTQVDTHHPFRRTVEAHAGPFGDLGVTDVVRLSRGGVYYCDEHLAKGTGVKHHAIEFADGTAPPLELVERFLGICDAAEGAVSVHCVAGLGRTGTLIGCHMIRRSGFTAREAIGWLRLCRPGSVIGPQQQFLEEYQERFGERGGEGDMGRAGTAQSDTGSAECWNGTYPCAAASAAAARHMVKDNAQGLEQGTKRVIPG